MTRWSKSSPPKWVSPFVVLLVEDLNEVLHDTLVKILATQMGVAICCHHFEDAVVNCQEGDIKGTTTKIVHEDVLLSLLVEAICNCCSCGLVDDTQNVHARNGAGILCRLSLRIVEICWDGDDGMLDLLTQVILSRLLHLDKNHG